MTGVFSRRRWLLAAGLLAFGSFGFAAAWILLGSRVDSLCTPLAVVAALDAALLLHLAKCPRGLARALMAMLATAAMALMALLSLICARIGQQFGLSAWESAQRIGFEPMRLIVEMSLNQTDVAWLLGGLVMALALSLRRL